MELDLEQLEIDEHTSPHPLKGEDKYTVYFVLKVGVLTLVFSFLRLILFPIESPKYNDHTDMKDTP